MVWKLKVWFFSKKYWSVSEHQIIELPMKLAYFPHPLSLKCLAPSTIVEGIKSIPGTLTALIEKKLTISQ